MKVEQYWQTRNWLAWVLYPVSLLFCSIVELRRFCYRLGFVRQVKLDAPVVIVGNITVGGTGKTPATIHLVNECLARGYRPGVISRGYRGQSTVWPRNVYPDSDPNEVGDEPVLIARQTKCPVVVGPDRVAAGRQLLAENKCDIIFSDDGMQHYRLGRTIEIAVIDAERELGNQFCLPAGPLRERVSRLKTVDFCLYNGQPKNGQSSNYFTLLPDVAINLLTGEQRPLAAFKETAVHALAGIGYPPRFFETLRKNDLKIIEHPMQDHHSYCKEDLFFDDGLAIIMTEKDAVKCRSLASKNLWYLPVSVKLHGNLIEQLMTRIPTPGNLKHG